jgi:hypothetical protein
MLYKLEGISRRNPGDTWFVHFKKVVPKPLHLRDLCIKNYTPQITLDFVENPKAKWFSRDAFDCVEKFTKEKIECIPSSPIAV